MTAFPFSRAARVLAALVLLTIVAAPAADGQSTDVGPGAPLVRLPFPQDDGTLTPYTFELGYPLVTLVYDTLLWRDEDGVPQPWLARSVEPSQDGRQLTVRLADGAAWHDGVPVTSGDIAFTFDFVAKRPHPRFSQQVAAVERVDTPDASTAVIVLRTPSPGFFDQPLSDVPILPAHIWRDLPPSKLAPDGMPVGSGPYRLTEHRPGEMYRFEANTSYFRGPPAAQMIEVPIITEAEETLAALEGRRVDMIPVNLPEEAVERLEGLGTPVKRGPSYLGTVLVFNLRTPPFDRVEARQAVAAALNVRRIATQVGDAVAAEKGYVHPASPWSSSRVLHLFRPEATVDPGLLALASIPVLAPDNDPVKVTTSERIAQALQRRGIRAEAKALPFEEFSRALGEDGAPPTFQMAVSTSPPLASYDPDFLRWVFGADPGLAPLNYAGYRNPAFDRQAGRIAITADPDARRAVVDDVLQLLADDVPVLPLFFSNGAYSYRRSVFDGWVFVKGGGILDKQSFLAHEAADPEPTTPVQPAEDTGINLGLVALGLAAVALVVGGVAVLSRR